MPRLRDGVIGRGTPWSYVVRAIDPETGRSRPRWVGGFATETAAKAARDDARVRARHGEYVDRSRVTVCEYLADWLVSHEASIKPETLDGYRDDIGRCVLPRIGGLRLRSLRAAMLS